MRPRILVLSAALLLAIVAGQGFLLQSTDSGAAGAGSVISHTTFSGGCAGANLHVMRYIPADSIDFTPLIATWCA